MSNDTHTHTHAHAHARTQTQEEENSCWEEGYGGREQERERRGKERGGKISKRDGEGEKERVR